MSEQQLHERAAGLDKDKLWVIRTIRERRAVAVGYWTPIEESFVVIYNTGEYFIDKYEAPEEASL